MVKLFEKFFCEDNGNPSSMRLIMFLVVSTVLFNWTYLTVLSGKPVQMEMVDLGALGIPMLFKMMQKGKEE